MKYDCFKRAKNGLIFVSLGNSWEITIKKTVTL